MNKYSVISLISHDAHLLPNSIKSYYDYVDEIILGLDIDRISWSNKKFSFDEDKLFKELAEIDKDDKIKLVEANFHPSAKAIDNDTYERNYLKSQCSNDIIISIDADEILINPKPFFYDYMPIVAPYIGDINLAFTWFLPYKEIDDKVLYISMENGLFFNGDIQGFVCHKKNNFVFCRWTDQRKVIKSPLAIMHYSFCRPEEDNAKKIAHYGHSDTAHSDPFYHIQRQITLDNYKELKNFKTSNMGPQWPCLRVIEKTKLMDKAREDASKLI